MALIEMMIEPRKRVAAHELLASLCNMPNVRASKTRQLLVRNTERCHARAKVDWNVSRAPKGEQGPQDTKGDQRNADFPNTPSNQPNKETRSGVPRRDRVVKIEYSENLSAQDPSDLSLFIGRLAFALSQRGRQATLRAHEAASQPARSRTH